MPTAVSAIKVDGKRAYQRVRDGEEVELEARPVTVHELVVHEVRPRATTLDVDVSVRCSSGTYIRAIARDLGAALGVGGHLTALRRTAVGPYDLADARTLERAGRGVHAAADRRGRARGLPVRRPRRGPGRRRPGRPRARPRAATGSTAVFAPDGEFLALYEPRDGRRPGRSPSSSEQPVGSLPAVQIWRSLDDVPADLGRTVVVIGNFDGVHLGHRHVLARAREVADERGLDASWR